MNPNNRKKHPMNTTLDTPTAKMAKPIITLKNIKFLASRSEETYCYSATLYVNGKKTAEVGNHGHGGCDDYYPIKGAPDWPELDKQIKETYPKRETSIIEKDGTPWMMEESLETLCHQCVAEWLKEKDFKKAMKRILYVHKGEKAIYQVTAKYKPTKAQIDEIKKKASWAKDAIFLHDLPIDEARKMYWDNIQEA